MSTMRSTKYFLFKTLKRDLKKNRVEIGVDAACEMMKNRKFFKTEKYFGVDISSKYVKKGIFENNSNTFGILDDMQNLNLTVACADVMVSTNTMHHLPLDAQPDCVARLSNAVRPGCNMYMNKLNDEALVEILQILRNDFTEVELVYYGSRFVCAFEERMMVWGKRNSLRRFLSPIAKIISVIDGVVANKADNTQHIYLRCHSRKNNGQPNSDILAKATSIGTRLFTYLPEKFEQN